MGTRHLICAIVDNTIKLAQYGQWDGYFSGQGQGIVDFILNKMDITKFKDALRECSFITENEAKKLDKLEEIPKEFSRDCGSDILKLIQDEGIRKLYNSYNFGADSLFCEFAYILDMDNNILEVYTGFNKNPLEELERFYPISKNDNGYYAIKLFKKFPFSFLTMDTMKNLEKE